jgi:sec-independent protein translocase protein TatA
MRAEIKLCYAAPCVLPARGSIGAGLFAVQGLPTARPVRAAANPRWRGVSMGLFGLGLPEVAVIAGVGILIFGPSKIASMGKDLGGIAGSVKKATSEFQEAMSDSLAEADREIEKKKMSKTVDSDVVTQVTESEIVDASIETPEAKKAKSG